MKGLSAKRYHLITSLINKIFFFKFQYPLGLYDCNETKTADVIKLLKELQQKYVPHSDGEICEPVLLTGHYYFLDRDFIHLTFLTVCISLHNPMGKIDRKPLHLVSLNSAYKAVPVKCK